MRFLVDEYVGRLSFAGCARTITMLLQYLRLISIASSVRRIGDRGLQTTFGKGQLNHCVMLLYLSLLRKVFRDSMRNWL